MNKPKYDHTGSSLQCGIGQTCWTSERGHQFRVSSRCLAASASLCRGVSTIDANGGDALFPAPLPGSALTAKMAPTAAADTASPRVLLRQSLVSYDVDAPIVLPVAHPRHASPNRRPGSRRRPAEAALSAEHRHQSQAGCTTPITASGDGLSSAARRVPRPDVSGPFARTSSPRPLRTARQPHRVLCCLVLIESPFWRRSRVSWLPAPCLDDLRQNRDIPLAAATARRRMGTVRRIGRTRWRLDRSINAVCGLESLRCPSR